MPTHWPPYYARIQRIFRRREGLPPFPGNCKRAPAWRGDLMYRSPRFTTTRWNVPLWLLDLDWQRYTYKPGAHWWFNQHVSCMTLLRYHCFAWAYLHHGSFQERKPPAYFEVLAMRSACRLGYELTTALRRKPFCVARCWCYLDCPRHTTWSDSEC